MKKHTEFTMQQTFKKDRDTITDAIISAILLVALLLSILFLFSLWSI